MLLLLLLIVPLFSVCVVTLVSSTDDIGCVVFYIGVASVAGIDAIDISCVVCSIADDVGAVVVYVDDVCVGVGVTVVGYIVGVVGGVGVVGYDVIGVVDIAVGMVGGVADIGAGSCGVGVGVIVVGVVGDIGGVGRCCAVAVHAVVGACYVYVYDDGDIVVDVDDVAVVAVVIVNG